MKTTLWRLADFINGYGFKPSDFSDAGLPVVRIRQLVDREAKFDLFDGRLDSKYLIDDGDLIFSWSGSLAVRIWDRGEAFLNQHLFKVEPAAGVHKAWLRWLIKSCIPRFEGLMHGSTMTHLNLDMLRLPVELPSFDEQMRIADFLDAEISRIEYLLVTRRRQVELLTLRREREIEQSLRLGGSFERSGMIPLKYLVDRVSVGIVITPAAWYVENAGVPALRGVNVRPGEITIEEMIHISNEGHALHQKSRLDSGDLVVVRTGQAGVAAVVPSELDGANCIDLVIIKTGGKISSKYLEYILNSGYAKRRVSEYSVGSIQSHFNVSAMKSLPVPVLDLGQQEQVVEELDRNVGVIDELKERILRQIELVEERKRALINAAVTGQIDVTTARGADLS